MMLSFNDFETHLTFKKWLKENLPILSIHDGVVYKLFTAVGGNRIAIPRVGATDEAGILYIGKTTNPVENRLALLYRSFKARHNKLWLHGADEVYWQCSAVQDKYPFENIQLQVIVCKDCKQQEAKEISTYYRQFREVPPFNGAIVKVKKSNF